MQFVPVSPTETMIREIAYVRPDERRETRALRAISTGASTGRSTPRTPALIAGVQAGMASSSYTTGPISPSEVCLKGFAERLTRAIPEARAERPVH